MTVDISKPDRADLFRRRLADAMARAGSNRSDLARACGVDRSTVAQLLSGDEPRLPNAHLAALCASHLGVSLDWLLGLTERAERAAEVLAASVQMADARRTPADEQIGRWFQEAAGYKIRHVPATLPDLLKTESVLDFEYAAYRHRTPEQAGTVVRNQLDWLAAPGSDFEICTPVDQVIALAYGEGYWRGLPRDARAEQIDHMSRLCRDHYPSLRLYLYDVKRVYSAPVTIFGPLLAAVYVGRFYLVLRTAERIRAVTEHFDHMVREADVEARRVSDYLAAALRDI